MLYTFAQSRIRMRYITILLKQSMLASFWRGVRYVTCVTQHLFELIEWQPPAPGQDNANRPGANRDTSAYTAQSYSNMGGMEQYNQLPSLQRSIIKFIIDNKKGAEGVHVAAILRGLNTDRSKLEYVAIFTITIGLISLFHQSRYRKATR